MRERVRSAETPAERPPTERRPHRRRRSLLAGGLALAVGASLLGVAVSLAGRTGPDRPVDIDPAAGTGQGLGSDQGLGPDQPGDVLGLGRSLHVVSSARAGGDGSAAAPFGGIQAALEVAQPGDTVRVAPGTYPGPVRTVRSGTTPKPIWLLGDRARIVPPAGGFPPPPSAEGTAGEGTGGESTAGEGTAAEDADPGKLVTIGHDHIVLTGFDIGGANKNIWLFRANYVRILHNTIHDAQGECVRIKYFSSHNEIAYNTVARCGLGNFTPTAKVKNGEAVYIGTAPEQRGQKNPTAEADRSDFNHVHDNDISTRAECVDVKEGAGGNVVRHNNCRGGEDPKGGGFSSRGVGTSFIDNVSRDHAGAGIRLGGDRPSDGVRSVVRGNRLVGNRGVGIKVQTGGPQSAICENLVEGNVGGPTNVPALDPAAPCPSP